MNFCLFVFLNLWKESISYDLSFNKTKIDGSEKFYVRYCVILNFVSINCFIEALSRRYRSAVSGTVLELHIVHLNIPYRFSVYSTLNDDWKSWNGLCSVYLGKHRKDRYTIQWIIPNIQFFETRYRAYIHRKRHAISFIFLGTKQLVYLFSRTA